MKKGTMKKIEWFIAVPAMVIAGLFVLALALFWGTLIYSAVIGAAGLNV